MSQIASLPENPAGIAGQAPLRAVSGTRLTGPGRWLARLVWAVIVVLALAILYQMLRANFWDTWGERTVQQASPALRGYLRHDAFVRYLIVLEWVGMSIALAVAFLIAWKRWDDWLGLLTSATLVLLALIQVSPNTDDWRFPPLLSALDGYTDSFLVIFVLGLMLFFFLFPSGRFVPRWSYWFLVLGIGAVPGIWAINTVFPLSEGAAWGLFVVVIVLLVASSIAAQVYRYRRLADAVQRQQTRLVVIGLSGMIVWLGWSIVAGQRTAWTSLVELHLNWLSFTLIPLSIGISILRYRLWEIDILLNRTVVYSALTILILLIYGLLVGGLALIFQAQTASALAIVATALAVLLAFPLRQGLQQVVNRLMYGMRDDPVAVLSRLGQRLEATGDTTDAMTALVDTVAHSLRLPYVTMWLKGDSDFALVAQHGQYRQDAVVYPIIHQGETVGRLVTASRTPEEPFSTRRGLVIA